MKIRMITTAAGPAFVFNAGTVYDVNDTMALALVGEKIATPLDEAEYTAAVEKEAALAKAEQAKAKKKTEPKLD